MYDFDIHFLDLNYNFPMIFVKGTGDSTYLFGSGEKVNIRIHDFFISKYLVTQKLWTYIMKTDPARWKGDLRPAEKVSFDDITQEGGFITKFNAVVKEHSLADNSIVFSLPSETEWEYAARGGSHWKDDFEFSGSDNLDEVGWYELNSGPKEIVRIKHRVQNTAHREVGKKKPNQLGIHDMSGNVWEWCEDAYQPDISLIPGNGEPYAGESDSRVLRGGCHHNFSIHCTVSKRYEIAPRFGDECIGFRIVGRMKA